MTDKDFEKLKTDLENAINEVDRLQALYKNQTGRLFVKPLYLDRDNQTYSGNNCDSRNENEPLSKGLIKCFSVGKLTTL